MKYILFNRKTTDIGGLGHSFTDYLSSYILSHMFNIPFIFVKFDVLINRSRYMDVENTSDKFYWNDYLNLNQLNSNIIHINHYNLKNFQYIPINIGKKWNGLDFNELKIFIEENNKKYENIIYYLTRNTRIYFTDFFYYEKIHNTNHSYTIYNELNRVFYLKHNKLIKNKKIINLYLRGGDLRKTHKKRNGFNINYPFEKSSLQFIINHIQNLNDYTINIISAGNNQDLIDIQNNFGNNPHFNILFNKDETQMFYLMTQSDILIYKESQFPLTASFYSNGLIIRKYNDDYNSKLTLYPDNITFFNNYLFIESLNDSHIDIIYKYL